MDYVVGTFPRIDAIIRSINVGDPWEKATTSEACHMYRIRAAMNMDIFEPFSDEQQALNAYLSHRIAGLRLCDYAWRLFVHPCHSFVEPDN